MKTYPLILLSIVLSTLFSSLIVFFYFAYIDVQTFIQNKLVWRGSEADWSTFSGAMVLGSAVVWIVSSQRARLLQDWEKRLKAGDMPAPKLPNLRPSEKQMSAENSSPWKCML